MPAWEHFWREAVIGALLTSLALASFMTFLKVFCILTPCAYFPFFTYTCNQELTEKGSTNTLVGYLSVWPPPFFTKLERLTGLIYNVSPNSDM